MNLASTEFGNWGQKDLGREESETMEKWRDELKKKCMETHMEA